MPYLYEAYRRHHHHYYYVQELVLFNVTNLSQSSESVKDNSTAELKVQARSGKITKER